MLPRHPSFRFSPKAVYARPRPLHTMRTNASRITHHASRCLCVLCGFAVLALAGCSKPVAKPDPNVVVKVGSVEIRVEDFNREMELRLKANRTGLSENEL